MQRSHEHDSIVTMSQVHSIHIQYYQSSIGELLIGSFDSQLCLLDFRHRKMQSRIDNRLIHGLKSHFVEQDDNTITEAISQLQEYLAGSRQQFDLPLLMVGSDFQQQVWRALQQIPYGSAISYTTLAKMQGDAKAVRAVASANAANAIAIIIPCHRVIASDGSLGGYSGGQAIKKRLLQLETP